MTTAYPLAWPEGWPRSRAMREARFKVTFEKAVKSLDFEIQQLGGTLPVLSTNVPRRLDGSPYMAGKPDGGDTGVAVYFQWRGKPRVFACDRWDAVKDNVRAIQKTLEALRGIERWGASEMMERAFQAFIALPPPTPWHKILGVQPTATPDDISAAHRRLAYDHHPDRGGSTDKMAEINEARDRGMKERAIT